MPPRKKRATRAAVDDADIELANLDTIPAGFTTLTPTEQRREQEVEAIFNELGSDSRIKVWQVIDGKASYAGDVSGDGFSLDVLLDTFGGGEKSLVIMQGKTKVDTVKVSLDPSIPPKNPRMPKVAAVQPAAGGLPDLAGVFAAMATSQMQSAQMMTTMMGGVVSALTAVMTASKPQTDPMDTALRMAEVMNKRGDGGGVSEAMTMFREGMQLAERYAGKGGDEDDGVMGVVSKGMDTLAVLINGIVEERKGKAAAVRTLPAPAATNGDGTPPPAPAPVEGSAVPANARPWVAAVGPHINQLLGAASFMPAEAAAATINKMLNDEQFSDLIDDIQQQEGGGFGTRLVEYFPQTQSVSPEWLGGVIQELLEYVEVDDDEATPPVNGNGGA